MKCRNIFIILPLAFLVLFFGSSNEKVNAAALSSLPAGTVIKIGGRPWVWIGSTTQTGTKAGYGYIMAMYNYGNYAWGTNNTNPNTAISVTSDTGAIYTSLPATIGGVAKATALGSHTWQWCYTPHEGNIVDCDTLLATSTSRLSLPSYMEWQGASAYNAAAPANTVGDIVSKAYSSGTTTTNSGFGFAVNVPRLRSSAYTPNVYSIAGDGTYAMYSMGNGPTGARGMTPVAWLLNSITTEASTVFANRGSGTYADPYCLTGECNTAPAITTSAKQTANNGSTSTALTNSYVKNGNKLYISGTITDPDAQNWTVSYSLSASTTPGSWTVCRSASSTRMGSVVDKEWGDEGMVVG